MSNEQLNESPNPSEMLKSAQEEKKVIPTKLQSHPIVMRPRFGNLLQDILCTDKVSPELL